MASVTKVKGGKQDLMWGNNQIVQTRSGQSVTVDQIDMTLPVDTKAALKLLDVSTFSLYFRTVTLLGNVTKGDSGAGLFYNDPLYAKASADDFDIIIDSKPGLLGCWRRIIQSTRKTTSGSNTFLINAGAYSWSTAVVHGLDSDDIDVGAGLSSTVSPAAASTSELLIVLPSGQVYSFMAPASTIVVSATLPIAGTMRIGVANNHGTQQQFSVNWWARKRSS